MIATLIISIVTFVGITLSILLFPHIRIGRFRLDTYWTIALIGAILLIVTSLAPIQEVWSQLTSPNEVNPLKIIVLFFSMTFLSVFLDETGLFRVLAKLAAKEAKDSQLSLFFIFYLLASALTAFTSNDIVILTLTPFICFFCKNTKIDPLPFLIAEFAAANTWSMALIIGNPTNIYLGTSAHINFFSYIKVMILPTLAAGGVELLIIFLLFRKKLMSPLTIVEDDFRVESKVDLWVGIAHLAVCLIFLSISSYLHIEMWAVSLSCAVSLMIFIVIMRLVTKRHWNYIGDSLKRLPYQLIPFFLSMFVIVVAWNAQGLSSTVSQYLSQGPTVFVYGATSYLASNVINNIPMSILFSNLMSGYTGTQYIQAVYATIIGSNIGAFLTPLGALAGIMFSSLLMKHEVRFTFLKFVKYGVVVSVPTLATALLVLFAIV